MNRTLRCCLLIPALVWAAACGDRAPSPARAVNPPPGYSSTLEVNIGGQRVQFGPFVGYYFRPLEANNLERVSFVCYNERQFYASDLPENELLYQGEGVLTRLPPTDFPIPRKHRINPVFFEDAPDPWLQTRPSPEEEYRHFHSCYDASGARRYGYWLRHVAEQAFTYDMGSRVAPGSPLYHKVKLGPDTEFAAILEFDHGPDSEP